MLNGITNIVEGLLIKIGFTNNENLYSDLASIAGILSAVGVFLAFLSRYIRKSIDNLSKQRPIDALFEALKGYSVASKVEVIYQIRCYRQPRFKEGKSLKQLIKQIKEASGNRKTNLVMFSIIGSPACGKTTTMRYVYCSLAKIRKCVYFQMQHVTSREALSKYLAEQKAECGIPNDASVVAFFDGLDEAHEFFRKENAASMEDAFRTLFFDDPRPKINQVFLENKLVLACMVISLRPEFLEKSVYSLTALHRSNVYQKVYEILGMTDKDVIKIFKSLQVLKKLEAKYDLKADSKLEFEKGRHQNRVPARREMWKYTRLFRNILKENPNCIFQYPIYIRYAYAFMKEYINRQKDGTKIVFTNNIAVSFDILVAAIIKWEFHVYTGKSSKDYPREFDCLTEQMEHCAQDIAVHLYHAKSKGFSRSQFEKIIRKYFQDEISSLVVAHCFMISNDGGQEGIFTFVHNTFQEYFFAQYLFERADYDFRKECLCDKEKSAYLVKMYYSILCRDTDVNRRISESISASDIYVLNKTMMPESYILINENTTIELNDDPKISMVEILEYIPYIGGFSYRGRDYRRIELEGILKSKRLDLTDTSWTTLNYAKGVIPSVRVVSLNISNLPLKDVKGLEEYQNLKFLDMRFQPEDASILEEIYTILRQLELLKIQIYSKTGAQCRNVYNHLCKGDFKVSNVLVETPNYSQAHITIYELNQRIKKAGHSVSFGISVRSDIMTAIEMNKSERNFEMLRAVFELEADEKGVLTLSADDAGATLWNGISLVLCYEEHYEHEEAYQICQRIEPFIEKDGTRLSYDFGDRYGDILIKKHQYGQAKRWLSNSYQYAGRHVCKFCKAKLGLNLFHAWIFSGDPGIQQFGRELEDWIKKLPDYQKDWRYARLLALYCLKELKLWRRGDSQPKDMERYLSEYRMIAKDPADRFDVIYFELICANRTENLVLGEQLLESLAQLIQNDEDSDDKQWKYNAHIRYYQQKLYYSVVKDERDEIIIAIDKLLEYPNLQDMEWVNQYESVRLHYASQQGTMDISRFREDKHLLWEVIEI